MVNHRSRTIVRGKLKLIEVLIEARNDQDESDYSSDELKDGKVEYSSKRALLTELTTRTPGLVISKMPKPDIAIVSDAAKC